MQRRTLRKQLIFDAFEGKFAGKAVLLDEFRWHVAMEEARRKDHNFPEMTRSIRNSLSRTISAMREFEKHELGKPVFVNDKLLARVACYRLRHWSDIQSLLTDPHAECVIEEYRTEHPPTFRREKKWTRGFRPVGFDLFAFTWRRGGHSCSGAARLQMSKEIVCVQPRGVTHYQSIEGLAIPIKRVRWSEVKASWYGC
jgi:hypothetical protein